MARARTLEKQDYSNYLALMKYYASRAKQEQDAALAQQKLESTGKGGGSSRSSAKSGGKKTSLSSAASESLERTMNRYLGKGDTRQVKKLFMQYRNRMTPLQLRRFEKLLGQNNIPMTE